MGVLLLLPSEKTTVPLPYLCCSFCPSNLKGRSSKLLKVGLPEKMKKKPSRAGQRRPLHVAVGSTLQVLELLVGQTGCGSQNLKLPKKKIQNLSPDVTLWWYSRAYGVLGQFFFWPWPLLLP